MSDAVTEPTLDELLAKSRDLARRISLDAEDMVNGELPFDRQQMENELTESLVVFAHECLHADARSVNSHAAMLAALKEMMRCHVDATGPHVKNNPTLRDKATAAVMARAAIALAEEG